MDLVKRWGLALTLGGLLGAQPVDDPVMKARQQRSQAQGIEEGDLPPVPRAILEPPPLLPPEIHAKDAPHPKGARIAKRLGSRKRVKGAEPGVVDPAPKPKAARRARPGKVAKAPRKRVKA
jgi:hypothetical protein